MKSNNSTYLRERIAESVSKEIENRTGIGWPCLAVCFGEPKMPLEMILEDCED